MIRMMKKAKMMLPIFNGNLYGITNQFALNLRMSYLLSAGGNDFFRIFLMVKHEKQIVKLMTAMM